MQSKFFVSIFLTTLLCGASIEGVGAQNIPFSGVVQPTDRIYASATVVVSFSNRAALIIPATAGRNGEVSVSDKNGNRVQQFELITVTSSGSQSQVALVELSADRSQSFTICQGKRCTQFKVLRY